MNKLTTLLGQKTRRVMIAGVVALWGVMAVALPASADQRDFSFTNSSGYVVDQLYVAPSASSDWDADILGTDVLDGGVTANIVFGRYAEGTCKYDIKTVFTDQSSLEAYEFDLCSLTKVELAADGVFYYS
jgi:hypothetical protein